MNSSQSSLAQKSRLKYESRSRPGLIVKLAAWQFAGTILFSLVLYVFTDTRVAVSALIGGSIAALTSLYMAGRLFAARARSGQSQSAPQMLARFYASVVLKVLFTLSMMAICIIVIKVSVAPFIIAYLIAAVVINLLFLLVPADDVIVQEDQDAGHEKI